MKLFVHMKAQPQSSIGFAPNGVQVAERTPANLVFAPGSPTHFLPCFPTREAAIAWVGKDDGLIQEAEQIEVPK